MRQAILWIILPVLFLCIAYATLWGTLAIWYKAPGSDSIRGAIAGCFGVFGLGALVALFNSTRWRYLLVFAVVLVGVNIWWNTLRPPTEGNWSPELARQVTGTIEGDTLTLTNVRAFDWRSKEDFTENWVTRSYDLSELETVDLFMSYWAGPNMAHFMLSFGFSDGEYLAWSDEVRREIDGGFSPVADFFKAHALAVVAAEERDVVGVRSNIEKARVQIFRLQAKPESSRELIEAYVAAANAIAQRPIWFNSVFTNCSRSVIKLMRYIGIDLPFDYRVIVNGYFPDYLYELGAMNSDVPLEELYRLGDISERARAVGLTEAYSSAIREGVPSP